MPSPCSMVLSTRGVALARAPGSARIAAAPCPRGLVGLARTRIVRAGAAEGYEPSISGSGAGVAGACAPSASTSVARGGEDAARAARVRARAAARRREQMTYKFSAIAATLGIGGVALFATYQRFSFLYSRDGATLPWLDMACTLALVAGGMFGMEMWARWAHKALWHDFEPGWAWHKSHHEPRVGPFETNDIYAVINAVPAMGLCLYGFLTPTLLGSLSFGAGLGITLFGWAYVFVHDGLVHRRFPTGPIADLPYMRRVMVAHKVHHSERYGGVPFGLFFGPQELEAIGAGAELDRLVAEMDKAPARVN
ncbi:beta-carotene hydroxylase [Raphidocelis subcapitata]|uniref:beta-carotene 3-hydroxylase n=1 Tax=Raphidocelis subcapitata TaxID=307507 RepID=A0A2V0PNU5_9CHLO|nr:beta-carotene hydroxylase [Raphidocelis subcapitata]|eukprot:GBF98825.1 beta-carotene hydroxylase [Raphidocelis subcapitata]